MTVAAIILMLLAVVVVIAIVGAIVALAVSKSKKPTEAVITNEGSYFDGGYFAYIGYSLLVGFVTSITLGIAFPWMCCLLQRWKAKHTVVCGKRQVFDGTGVQLIGKFILWGFLTVITFGIYGFWMVLAIKKWTTKHTHFVGEEDNNSYFDGGVLGFIGTNILAGLVTFIPFVGLAWSNIIKLRWERAHTVVDSRRLVFVGAIGNFFVKYLIWGFLTIITFGIFGLFVPVKNLKLEAENTIDHEHTDKALMEQSEYRSKVSTAVSANKNGNTAFEMESLKAGINDTTDEDALRALADSGLRSAQYLYVTKYAEGQYTAEPFSSLLKASAEAEYAPAMCLYAHTHPLDENYKNELLCKSAEQGQTKAMHSCMVLYANQGLSENNQQTALPLLEKAVFFADVLQASGEELTAQEQALINNCTMRLRKIASNKGVLSKVSAGVVAIVIACFAILMIAILAVVLLFMPTRAVIHRPAQEYTTSQTVGNTDGVAATPAPSL